MDASEFAANYQKYLSEIERVVSDYASPVVASLKRKDPLTLVKPKSVFRNELEARGFVWNKFIEAVNKYSNKQIKIPIKNIRNLHDIERFMALVYKERIYYHPQTSFHDIMNSDLYGIPTCRTFSDEEAERLDKLNLKCHEIAEENQVDIFKLSMHIQRLIWGNPPRRKQK